MRRERIKMRITTSDNFYTMATKANAMLARAEKAAKVSKEDYHEFNSIADDSLKVINDSLASGYFYSSGMNDQLRETKATIQKAKGIVERKAIKTFQGNK